MHRLFHATDFVVCQQVEMTRSFSNRKSAIVLQAETNKEVDLPVGHIDNFLYGLLGFIILCKKRQFLGKFRFNGLVDKPKKLLHLGRNNISESLSFRQKL